MARFRIEGFAQHLHQEVLARIGDDNAPQLREETFTESVLELLDEHDEVEGWDVCSYEAKSAGRIPAAKLSAWSLSGDGASLDLFVTQYFGTGRVEEVGKPDVRRQFDLLLGFLKRAIGGFHTRMEESDPAFAVAQRIYQSRDRLTTTRLFYLTDGLVRSLDVGVTSKTEDIDVRCVVWDLDKLSRLQVGQREIIELDFENRYGGHLPCLQISDATSEYRTLLAYIPAPLLARIYDEHGQRLLERNVRAFLQARGKVNRGLQKTLKDEPHRFLAYNNGLCCTASEVRVQVTKEGHGRLFWAKDFQIVNGGQTTASIHHAVKKANVDVSKVVVQVKLTVLSDPAKVPEIVPQISLYANSQNKVNTADFSANGTFHHQLEQLSRTVWAPPMSGLERGTHWYYERARGSYADDKARQGRGKEQRDWQAQNPLPQKFTKTDLAKFEHAWIGLPHIVCFGAEKNFIRFAERMEAEGLSTAVDEEYFKRLVAKALIFRNAEKCFSSLNLVGYRANSVAYAIAWLALRSEWRIDLDKIWDHQCLPASLLDALRVVCRAAHEHILSQHGNLGEATKREHCWEAFRKQEIRLDDSWQRDLSDRPYVVGASEDDLLSQQWELTRQQFLNDPRTLGELEAETGQLWIATRRRDAIGTYADLPWERVRDQKGLGTKKLRGLVELLAAAARE